MFYKVDDDLNIISEAEHKGIELADLVEYLSDEEKAQLIKMLTEK